MLEDNLCRNSPMSRASYIAIKCFRRIYAAVSYGWGYYDEQHSVYLSYQFCYVP